MSRGKNTSQAKMKMGKLLSASSSYLMYDLVFFSLKCEKNVRKSLVSIDMAPCSYHGG